MKELKIFDKLKVLWYTENMINLKNERKKHMFCTNCGANIGDNEKFCTNCGARQVPEESAQMANMQNSVQVSGGGVQTDTYKQKTQGQMPEGFYEYNENLPEHMPKKKKRGKKKAIIAAVVAGSLVVTTGLAALVSPAVRNTFARTVMSDEKYFKHVQENNAETFAKDVSKTTSAFSNFLEGKSVAETDIELILEEGGMQLIADNADPEVAEVFEQMDQAAVSIGVEGNAKGIAMDGAAKINGTTLADIKYIFDIESKVIYMQFPSLSNKTVRVDVHEAFEEVDFEEFAYAIDAIEEFTALIPDQASMEKLLTRYMKCIAESVTDVEERTVTLEVGDVSQKCVQQEIKITQKLVLKVAKAVIQEAQSDKDLENIIRDMAKYMGGNADSTYEEFKTTLEKGLETLDAVEATSETMGRLKFWVNNKGEIIGFGFEMNKKYGDGEFSAYTLEKGNKFAEAIIFEAEGQKISLKGDGTIKGGKRNGKFKLNVLGTDYVEFKLSDVDDKKLENGVFDGKITIAPTEASASMIKAMADSETAELLDGFKVEIDCKRSGDTEGEVALTVHLANSPCATLKVGSKVSDRAFALPDPSGTFIDTDDYIAIGNWGEELLEALQDNMNAAGIDVEM